MFVQALPKPPFTSASHDMAHTIFSIHPMPFSGCGGLLSPSPTFAFPVADHAWAPWVVTIFPVGLFGVT